MRLLTVVSLLAGLVASVPLEAASEPRSQLAARFEDPAGAAGDGHLAKRAGAKAPVLEGADARTNDDASTWIWVRKTNKPAGTVRMIHKTVFVGHNSRIYDIIVGNPIGRKTAKVFRIYVEIDKKKDENSIDGQKLRLAISDYQEEPRQDVKLLGELTTKEDLTVSPEKLGNFFKDELKGKTYSALTLDYKQIVAMLLEAINKKFGKIGQYSADELMGILKTEE